MNDPFAVGNNFGTVGCDFASGQNFGGAAIDGAGAGPDEVVEDDALGLGGGSGGGILIGSLG